MRLKIKHFVGTLATVLLTSWGGCVVGLASGPSAPQGPEWAPAPPEDWTPDLYPDFSEDYMLVWRGQDIGEREVADAEKEAPYRVRVRQFLYDDKVSQIWVDLDRDWLWDLKGHFAEGKLYLRFDPLDTERYGPQLEWTGAGWILDTTWVPPSVNERSQELSPGVYAALDWSGRDLPEAILDVAAGETWKLDVYPGRDGKAERAELDLKRDGTPDQIWRFGDEIHVDMVFGDDVRPYRWNGERLVYRTTN